MVEKGEGFVQNGGASQTAVTPSDQHIEAVGARNDMPTPLNDRTTSPAFQFYPKDFLSSTKVQRMSLTEIGAYIVLLSHAWLAGGIPTDLAQIAKILKMPVGRFKRLWAGPLSESFVVRGEFLINERLDYERQKQIEYRRRQSDHGRKGGRRVALPNPYGSAGGSPSTRECKQEIFSSSDVVLKEKDNVIAFDGQAAFMRLCREYPALRVNDSQRVASLFIESLGSSHDWTANFELMMANLATHKASHEWAVKRMVPGMEKWLVSGTWKRAMEPDVPEAPKATARWANWKPTVNGKVVNE